MRRRLQNKSLPPHVAEACILLCKSHYEKGEGALKQARRGPEMTLQGVPEAGFRATSGPFRPASAVDQPHFSKVQPASA